MIPLISALKRERRLLYRSLRQKIAPKLRNSGYAVRLGPTTDPLAAPVGQTRPLKLCVWKEHKTHKIAGFILADVRGFTEDDGIIVDAEAGGLLTVGFKQLPLEDLIKLEVLLRKHYDTLE